MGDQNGKKQINAKTIMQEKNEQEKAKKYNQYVENKTPKPDLLKDMFNAFWVGGAICTIGQAFTNFYSSLTSISISSARNLYAPYTPCGATNIFLAYFPPNLSAMVSNSYIAFGSTVPFLQEINVNT